MKEFEKTLADAVPPQPPVEEFRRTLRRELLSELALRRARRTRRALIGMGAAAAMLAAVCAAFVLRPDVPRGLHAALFHGAAETVAPGEAELRRLLAGTGASAGADQEWIEGWYAGRPEPARVKALDDERLFALRRFELTSGERIVVLTEITGDPRNGPPTAVPAVRNF